VEFRALDPVGDKEVYDKLFREIADLQRQQKELRDKGSSPAE